LFANLALCQQPKEPPFKIAITAESPTVVAEGGVSIKVSLTNNSGHDVNEGVAYMTGINLDTSFQFEVRDNHGRMVPKRVYPHPELATGSVRFRTISAGETYTQEQQVSALYDMQKPGKYTIQVFRRISNDPKDDIKSNILKVTVTPKDKDPARKSGKVRN
jgi:hypothetical protein